MRRRKISRELSDLHKIIPNLRYLKKFKKNLTFSNFSIFTIINIDKIFQWEKIFITHWAYIKSTKPSFFLKKLRIFCFQDTLISSIAFYLLNLFSICCNIIVLYSNNRTIFSTCRHKYHSRYNTSSHYNFPTITRYSLMNQTNYLCYLKASEWVKYPLHYYSYSPPTNPWHRHFLADDEETSTGLLSSSWAP